MSLFLYIYLSFTLQRLSNSNNNDIALCLNTSDKFVTAKGESDIDGASVLVVICHSPISPVNDLLISRALFLFFCPQILIYSPMVSRAYK